MRPNSNTTPRWLRDRLRRRGIVNVRFTAENVARFVTNLKLHGYTEQEARNIAAFQAALVMRHRCHARFIFNQQEKTNA